MKFIMTNDVESHSFESNTLDDSIARRIENEAMPIFSHSVKCDFYIFPNIIY